MEQSLIYKMELELILLKYYQLKVMFILHLWEKYKTRGEDVFEVKNDYNWKGFLWIRIFGLSVSFGNNTIDLIAVDCLNES